jgi:hypothetical protein
MQTLTEWTQIIIIIIVITNYKNIKKMYLTL